MINGNFLIYIVTVFIRVRLSKKGFGSLRILGKSFRQVPSYNGYDKINKDKFLAVLRDMDILLAKQHSEVK